jgi:hypothetical protein
MNVFSPRREAATRTSPDAPAIASIVAALGVVGGSALIWLFCQRKTPCDHIVRGYFRLYPKTARLSKMWEQAS